MSGFLFGKKHLAQQLAEIMVYGSPEFETLGDCMAVESGTQMYGYAIGYTVSTAFFDDINRAFGEVTSAPGWISHMLNHLCSVYDAARYPEMTASGLFSAFQYSSPVPYTPTPYGLTSWPWSIFKVTGHWLWGNGAPMTMPLDQVGANLHLGNIGPPGDINNPGNTLEMFVNSHTSPGTYYYSSGVYGYETYNNESVWVSKLVLGGITMFTQGEFTRHPDGSWDFIGDSYVPFPDLFNMDKRPGRPFWADAVVDFFATQPGTDFSIDITGTIPTVLSGH